MTTFHVTHSHSILSPLLLLSNTEVEVNKWLSKGKCKADAVFRKDKVSLLHLGKDGHSCGQVSWGLHGQGQDLGNRIALSKRFSSAFICH